MKKKLATLALSGVLLCSMGFPAASEILTWRRRSAGQAFMCWCFTTAAAGAVMGITP